MFEVRKLLLPGLHARAPSPGGLTGEYPLLPYPFARRIVFATRVSVRSALTRNNNRPRHPTQVKSDTRTRRKHDWRRVTGTIQGVCRQTSDE